MYAKPDNHPLLNWIPYRFDNSSEKLSIRWLYTENIRFTDPFFDETTAKCLVLANNSRIYTSISNTALLAEAAKEIEHLEPHVFIFHVSRCGSTLVSQLLGLNEAHISLAEVPFFDDILRNQQLSAPQKEEMLSAAIKLTGQKRNGQEKYLFVKLDSWHIFFYEIFRKLYPETPFVLLFRSPFEVLQSHIKQPGMQAVQHVIEPELFGFEPEHISAMPMDQYTGLVLERYFQVYQDIIEKDPNVLLLNYHDGIMNIIRETALFANLVFEEKELEEMEKRSGFHSKFPDQPFSEKMPEPQIPSWLQTAMNLFEELKKQQKGLEIAKD